LRLAISSLLAQAKSADDFLPVLIYAVLQSNAPFLWLNMKVL
jgi:hypothetical protein